MLEPAKWRVTQLGAGSGLAGYANPTTVPRIGGARKAPVRRRGTAPGIWYNSRALSRMDSVAADNLVEIDNVEFRYDVRPVLKGINMRFPRGKVVSIMGLSGCGKTTTLRLIGGQLKPSRGRGASRGRGGPRRSTRSACTRCAGAWGCCSSSARCSPTCPCSTTSRSSCASTPALPEPMIRDLVLMKLNAVGLRGAQRLHARGAVRRDGAPGRAGARDRAGSDADHVRRAFRGPGPDLAGGHRQFDPPLERCLGRHLDRGHARRAGIAQDRRLCLLHVRRRSGRAGHAR